MPQGISHLPTVQDSLDVSLHSNFESVMDSTFSHKFRWFRKQCRELMVPWQQGHERFSVLRDTILEDSFTRVMALEPAAMHAFAMANAGLNQSDR